MRNAFFRASVKKLAVVAAITLTTNSSSAAPIDRQQLVEEFVASMTHTQKTCQNDLSSPTKIDSCTESLTKGLNAYTKMLMNSFNTQYQTFGDDKISQKSATAAAIIKLSAFCNFETEQPIGQFLETSTECLETIGNIFYNETDIDELPYEGHAINLRIAQNALNSISAALPRPPR